MDYRHYLCRVLKEYDYRSLPDVVCSVIITITKNSFLCESTITAYHTHHDNIVDELITMCNENLVEKENRYGKNFFRKRLDENKPCCGNKP